MYLIIMPNLFQKIKIAVFFATIILAGFGFANKTSATGGMTGDSAFYNLTILNNSGANGTTSPSVIFMNVASTTGTFTAITPSTKIQFPAGATTTFNNFTLNGQAAGTKIMLRVGATTTQNQQFNIDVLGTESISYTDFMDTNACDDTTNLLATDGTNADSGGNSCIDFSTQSTMTQRNFGWAVNDGNLSTGGLRNGINNPITSVRSGEVLRLRMDMSVTNATLAQSSKQFTLQYKTLGAGCASGSYTTIGTAGSSEIWRGYNNPSVADQSTLTNYILDPSNALESYEENGASVANPTAVSAGSAGEWDWVLQDNGAVVGESYCFKMVKTVGLADLNGYTNYPQLTTITSAASQGAAGSVIQGDTGAPSSENPTGGATNQGGGSGSGGGDGGGTPQGGGSDQGGGGGSTVFNWKNIFFATAWKDFQNLFSIFSFK